MNIRKNLLLSIVSLSFISFISNAQDAPPAADAGGGGFTSKVGYGAKIGIGSSYFSKEQFKVGGQIGGQIGGFVSYKVADVLKIQLEALYMQQGGRIHDFAPGDSPSGLVLYEESVSRITFHNIEAPLIVKIVPPVIGSIFGLKWHALAGPSVGFNMGSTQRTTTEMIFTDGNTVVVKEREGHATNDYSAIQWGGYLGAGIETELKSFKLTVDVRYRQGLNTVDYNYDIEKFIHGYGDNKSNTIAVTLGIGLK